MVDLTKPCVKCGAVDRYRSGNCKPCQKQSLAKYRQSDEFRAKRKAYLQSDEVRARIRAYNQSDENRAKQRAYRQSDEVRARIRDYQRHWCQSDEVRAKHRERQRKQRQTAIGRQRLYAAKAKYKKRLFEFSLQNQQKVIEQCQQNKPSGKEG